MCFVLPAFRQHCDVDMLEYVFAFCPSLVLIQLFVQQFIKPHQGADLTEKLHKHPLLYMNIHFQELNIFNCMEVEQQRS